MNAIPFDTHAFVKRLQSAGFTIEQAEALTDFFKESGIALREQIRDELQKQAASKAKESP